MINDHDFHNVTAWLEQCHRPLLVSHLRADGDSLGAIAAVGLALQKNGQEPIALLFESLASQYGFLSSTVQWHLWDEVREIVTAECDAVVLLDTCALAQLEPIAGFLSGAPRTLVIDHHATHDPIGVRDGDLRLFDETASATCQIVAEWIRSRGMDYDEPLATALFTGIATDCGWFRFSNTDPRTMRTAADLVEAGADASRIYSAIYQQEPPSKLRLIAHMLDHLELLAEDKLAVMSLRPADFEQTGADYSMTSDLVNEAGRLASTEATILFTEEPDKTIRVNFRSKQTLDVSEIARRFGGGGHIRAAGARLRGEWDNVVPRVIAEVVEAL